MWRADTTLCFNAVVGYQPKRARKSKKGSFKTPNKGFENEDWEEEDDDEELALCLEDDDSEGEGNSAPATPTPSKRSE